MIIGFLPTIVPIFLKREFVEIDVGSAKLKISILIFSLSLRINSSEFNKFS